MVATIQQQMHNAQHPVDDTSTRARSRDHRQDALGHLHEQVRRERQAWGVGGADAGGGVRVRRRDGYVIGRASGVVEETLSEGNSA
eukprot:scaffold4009_cov101-Isochrysis_galbana.AAC.9